jgi:hypothetical protein
VSCSSCRRLPRTLNFLFGTMFDFFRRPKKKEKKKLTNRLMVDKGDTYSILEYYTGDFNVITIL